MKICKEMVILRNKLDELNIYWVDKSSIVSPDKLLYNKGMADTTIFRTHFCYGSHFVSVINGFGTYGGINLDGVNEGKLEIMIDNEEPTGYHTAADVIQILKDLDQNGD